MTKLYFKGWLDMIRYTHRGKFKRGLATVEPVRGWPIFDTETCIQTSDSASKYQSLHPNTRVWLSICKH